MLVHHQRTERLGATSKVPQIQTSPHIVRAIARLQRGVRVKGVKEVINRITVARTNWKKDGELVKAINDRLKGDWTTWWAMHKINITVKNGVATLEGDVDKWDQRRKAGDLALQIAGISEVDNRLTVNEIDYRWDEYH